MKPIIAIILVTILAALSGCYSIRDFPEWTDRQDRIHTMLINNNNALFRRVEDLENDVRYLRRHATAFKTSEKPFKNAPREERKARKVRKGSQRWACGIDVLVLVSGFLFVHIS